MMFKDQDRGHYPMRQWLDMFIDGLLPIEEVINKEEYDFDFWCWNGAS